MRLNHPGWWRILAVCLALGFLSSVKRAQAGHLVSQGFVEMPDSEVFLTPGRSPFLYSQTQEAGIAVPASNKDGMSKSDRMRAQQKLAPPAVMIQSSLASALDQVRGMRTQLQIAQKGKEVRSVPLGNGQSGVLVISMNHDAIDGFRKQNKELRSNLGTAKNEEVSLKAAARGFPAIARSAQFQATVASLRELRFAYQDFAVKIWSQKYLNGRVEPNADLDNIEKKLSSAIEKTKALNFDRLDISIG